MKISTNEFLLGALNDMLSQQQNVNTLNREIATGQTLLDASTDPAGASNVLRTANTISQYNYDLSNAKAATASLQNGVAALQQVTTLLTSLRQTAVQAADVTTSPANRQSLIQTAQSALTQLIQLANTQGPNGQYLFGGSNTGTVPYSSQPNGQVIFNGDGAANRIEIAPSLSVPSSISGSGIFTNIPAGDNGISASALSANSGSGTAVAQGVTNISQLAAGRLANTQYEISFAAGPNNSLTYTVTSGTGAPGSAGFAATSGIVSTGGFASGSDLAFGGVDIRIDGTPAAGDKFDVQTGAATSMFQTVQNLVAALQAQSSSPAGNAQFQQAIGNVVADLDGAQTSALSAQASLGASLNEIAAVQGQDTGLNANAQAQLADLQSANLPQVMANYSESLTALQASQLAFAKVQGLSLFNYIHP